MKGTTHSPLDTLAPASPSPRGVGYYMTSRDMQRQPAEVVRLLQHSSAKWVALWVESPDGRTCSTERLRLMADAARDLAGCSVWVWTFPSAATPEASAARLGKAARATRATGAILDIERPPRPEDGPEWSEEAARILVRRVVDDVLREGVGLGVTSYPVRSAWADRIPWSELEIGHGQPQLYKSAAVGRTRERGIAEWKEAHGVVVPVVASYLGDHERLRSDLRAVCCDADGRTRVDGVGVWALATTDGRERAVLRETAQGFGW